MTKRSAMPSVAISRADTYPSVIRKELILITWLATLILSKLPLIIARDILGTDIPWITSAWIGIAALLFIATFIWQSIEPLRGYFLVLGVIYLWAVFDSIIRGTATWQNIVCACLKCNVKKGGRTPHQAHMKLIQKPVKPKRNPVIHIHLNHERYQSWKQFLDHAYWSVELT